MHNNYDGLVTYKKTDRTTILRRELQLKLKGKEEKECSIRWFSWVLVRHQDERKELAGNEGGKTKEVSSFTSIGLYVRTRETRKQNTMLTGKNKSTKHVNANLQSLQ
jgi:hypothetical protein